METKYIVVLGSLLSGLGKGIVTSSIAKILSFYGLRAVPLKFDGYLNYDCGTMNPFRHGEVFVLDDGSEVDMDFGNYERFLNRDMNGSFSLTGGKLFSELIAKERKGDFLGNDVQMIPHLTDMIIGKIEALSRREQLDVLLIEVGGTVGDIENSYFVEAMRQLALRHQVLFVDVTFVPELEKVGEQKSKPTQLALRSLRQEGIQPDFLICRAERPIDGKVKDKLALFSNIPKECIIDDNDISEIYEMPAYFMRQGLDRLILHKFGFTAAKLNMQALDRWTRCTLKDESRKQVLVSVVGKYVDLRDSYASVKEALYNAAAANRVNLKLKWVESETLEGCDDAKVRAEFFRSNGILVPGGFGKRGTEGMISAIRFARVNRVPYLGLCLGMQLMAIEFARNVCGIRDAGSAEFGETVQNLIDIMAEQKKSDRMGGTMRLGAWGATVKRDTAAYRAYGRESISERHRHRYEVNNSYLKIMEQNGLVVSAMTPGRELVEIVEWKDSFGVGTQAHPEFKSRPERPAPLFDEFMKSVMEHAAVPAEQRALYSGQKQE
jgi:CTP synthase